MGGIGARVAEGGYHRGGLNKIAAAMDISRHMRPDRNKSKSF